MALPSASRIDLADIVVGEECEGQENLGGEAGQRRRALQEQKKKELQRTERMNSSNRRSANGTVRSTERRRFESDEACAGSPMQLRRGLKRNDTGTGTHAQIGGTES